MAALRQGESLQGPGKTMPDLKEHEMGFWKKKKKEKHKFRGWRKSSSGGVFLGVERTIYMQLNLGLIQL